MNSLHYKVLLISNLKVVDKEIKTPTKEWNASLLSLIDSGEEQSLNNKEWRDS